MTGESYKVVILGTAQDAGVPQLGCECSNCIRALENNKFKHLVASIGIINQINGKAYIIDATPDITEQLSLLRKSSIGSDHRLTIEGIFLTHAHMGHYIGLVQLGKEAWSAAKLPIFGTPDMVRFLSTNHPFSDLIKDKNIVLNKISPDKKFQVDQKLTIIPIPVPHRQEHSDTVGFLIYGMKKQLLYIPDMDVLSDEILKYISKVDIAILDGTFYDKTELPAHRDYKEIQHPTISQSMGVLKKYLKNTKIYYTHFNHTNPILDKDSEALKHVKELGFKIVRLGQAIEI